MVESLSQVACGYRVDIQLDSRWLIAARKCSAGLLADCGVDLLVHAAVYTKRRDALNHNLAVGRKTPTMNVGVSY